MALERPWQILSLTNMSLVALSITVGVGIFMWPISVKNMCIVTLLWQLTKMAPSSASVAILRKFRMVVHLTCTSPLSQRCFSVSLLGSAHFVLI